MLHPEPRGPRTPHTTSSLASAVASLILAPPEGDAADPWAAAYRYLLPIFQPEGVPEAYLVILYVASAAWVVLWILALATLIVRARRIGFLLFTVQSGFIVPKTTTLFLVLLLAFLGVAQGYLWKTILIIHSWRNYPNVVALQAATWALLCLTAYVQAWGLMVAANFTSQPTRSLHSQDRPRTSRSGRSSRPTSSSGFSGIGRPFVPALLFNSVALVLPLAFLGGLIATGVYSSRHCSQAFMMFLDAEDLLLNASDNAAGIDASGSRQTVLAQVLIPLNTLEGEGAVCKKVSRIYYGLIGVVPTGLLIAEFVGFLALYRQLSAQLSLLRRAACSTQRWHAHEESFRQQSASPPAVEVPLALPSAAFARGSRPSTGGSSSPHPETPERQQLFNQAPPTSASLRLQRFPSSTTVVCSSENHGHALEPPKRLVSKTDESSGRAWVATDRGRRPPRQDPHIWVEAKLREVKRARRNLILQTVAWTVGAINYGIMSWLTFAGAGLSGIITVWSFVAMPAIALPILLTLLVNGLAGNNIDHNFIGLVALPDTVHQLAPRDEEDGWEIPSPTAAFSEKPPAVALQVATGPPTAPPSADSTLWSPQQRFASRRLPSWTFQPRDDVGSPETGRASYLP